MFNIQALSLTTLRHVKKIQRPLGVTTQMASGKLSGIFATPAPDRTYMRRKTIKLAPTKPLNFDFGGDIKKSLTPLDLSLPKTGFEDITELQEAEAEVQKLFSLEFGDGRDLLKKQVEMITEAVKDHPADVASLEYMITLQTVLIRNQMKHCLQFRKDKVAKMRLVKRLHSRKHRLHALRSVDFARFEWLSDLLQLEYRVPGAQPKVYGKRVRRQLAAREATMQVFKQKKHQLKEALAEQRAEFEKVKKEELDKIAKDLEELGLPLQDSFEETLNLLQHGTAKFKEKEYETRRSLMLQKKFKMREAKKKEQEEINYQAALYNL